MNPSGMKVTQIDAVEVFWRTLLRPLMVLSLALLTFTLSAQNVQVAAIGFYNFENMFDTLHSVDILDTERLVNPTSEFETDMPGVILSPLT